MHRPHTAARARDDADPDFVLIARTDARGAHGGSLDDAIGRANAFLEAGADMAFVEGPTNLDEVRRICREVKGPIFYNQPGVSPRLTQAQMEELGIALTILPGAALRATVKAVYDLGRALRDHGPEAEVELNEALRGHPLADLHRFAGFDQVAIEVVEVQRDHHVVALVPRQIDTTWISLPLLGRASRRGRRRASGDLWIEGYDRLIHGFPRKKRQRLVVDHGARRDTGRGVPAESESSVLSHERM